MVQESFKADFSKIRKILDKLEKKDPNLFEATMKKITQITRLSYADIGHFKNLRYGLKYYRRAHVGSFVLLFRLEGNVLYFDRFEHHDDAY